MAAQAKDVAQRPLNQNGKPITGLPVPAEVSSPLTVPQMNTRSSFSGTKSIGAGPSSSSILAGLAFPAGFNRLWSAMTMTDAPLIPIIFGDGPSSMLFIRFTRTAAGLVDVDLVNLDASPHTVEWAVGLVVANAAFIAGSP